MQNYFSRRPQTANIRNQSHIFNNEQNQAQQQSQNNNQNILRKRPQSYRNISKVSNFMNDYSNDDKQVKQIRYLNVIQNRDQQYHVERTKFVPSASQSHDFENFFEKTGGKLYKPVDQFGRYGELMKKNSSLLRRGQFGTPITNNDIELSKNKINSQPISKTQFYTTSIRTRGTTTNIKFSNSISSSLNQTIREKKSLKKQKQQFFNTTQKNIKPINKTFLGFANEYEQMMARQRQTSQKKTLENAMNRVLTMEVMGKGLKGLTKLYI